MPIDTNFFKNWTVESAYLVGLLASDGNIIYSKKPERWNVSLRSNDIEIVECFKRYLKSDNKIVVIKSTTKKFPNGKLYKCKQAYQIKIDSKEIYEDLIKIGLTPRKSLTLKWLKTCPKKYLPDLIRGYFDGDGCISIRKNRRASATWEICSGSIKFIEGLCECININLDIKKPNIKCKKKLYYLRYSKLSEIQTIINWIYRNSNELIRLKRKYEKCQQVTKFTIKKGQGQYNKKYDRWTGRVNGVLLPSYKTQEEFLEAKKHFLETGEILKNKLFPQHEAFGESKTLVEWAKDSRCKVTFDTLVIRVNKYKIPLEIALNKTRQSRKPFLE